MRQCKIIGKAWDGHKWIEVNGVCDFHQWAQEGNQDEGIDAVGIVEDVDGRVYLAPARCVQFLDRGGDKAEGEATQ